MARLIVKSGQETERAIDVDSETTLGRESADVVINDPEMSRRHAIVRPVQGGLEIEDKGSLNGTWVNGSRIESPALLADGDRILVGETSILVQIPASESGRTVARPSPAGERREATTREGSRRAAAKASAPPAGNVPPLDAARQPEPFGTFTPPETARRKRVATRRVTATILAFAVIIATGLALVVYFAQR